MDSMTALVSVIEHDPSALEREMAELPDPLGAR
jgi:hypothetical protein